MSQPNNVNSITKDEPKKGFQLQLIPERIIGSLQDDVSLKLLIKWKGTHKLEILDANVIKENCPSLLEAFVNEHNGGKTVKVEVPGINSPMYILKQIQVHEEKDSSHKDVSSSPFPELPLWGGLFSILRANNAL